jgi:hypothetical protein
MNTSNPTTKPQQQLIRSLTEIALDEKYYKPDLEVTDRYQTFSTEMLRLSLLGIAALGFLKKLFSMKHSRVVWKLSAGLRAFLGVG